MQDDTRTKTITAMTDLFGYGWRKVYAKAIGVNVTTITDMRGTTLKHAALIAEFLAATPMTTWPAAFADLAEMRKRKLKKDKA